MDAACDIPDTIEQLQVLDRQAEREWWWLNGALHAVAELKAEQDIGRLQCFREMQDQMREVDRRRVQIAVRIAEIQRTSSVLLAHGSVVHQN